jgi:hypothetical protein
MYALLLHLFSLWKCTLWRYLPLSCHEYLHFIWIRGFLILIHFTCDFSEDRKYSCDSDVIIYLKFSFVCSHSHTHTHTHTHTNIYVTIHVQHRVYILSSDWIPHLIRSCSREDAPRQPIIHSLLSHYYFMRQSWSDNRPSVSKYFSSDVSTAVRE